MNKSRRISKPRSANPTKRIAEALHRNKIDLVETLEGLADRLAEKTDSEFRFWLLDLQRDRLEESRLRQTMDELKADLVEGFVSIAQTAHHDLVGIYLESIPRQWFKPLLPAKVAPLLESEVTENLLDRIIAGDLDVDTPTELIAQGNLSAEEKAQLIEKLVFPPPSVQKVARIIGKADAQTNISWHDRFEKLSRKITNKNQLFKLLAQQFADGKSLDEIRREIQPVVSDIKSSAKRIARTEGMRVAERIQRETWDALGDMMVGAQIIAIKDQNTRSHHASRSGDIYYKKPTAGQLSLSDIPDLPDEPNCRCYSTPVLDPPEEIKNDPRARREFAAANGTKVADPVGYEDWFAGTAIANRQRAVGKQRYNLVKDQLAKIREPEWSDFVDADGVLLPMASLKKESAADRQSRKHAVKLELIRRRADRVDISRQGFVTPPEQPTLVLGQTFSGSVNVSDPASVIGELVRTKVAKGVRTEVEIRAVGSTIRNYIENQEVHELNKLRGQLDRAIEKLQKKKRPKREDLKTLIAARQKRQQIIELTAAERQKRYLDVMRQVRDMGSEKPQPVKRGSSSDVARLFQESQRFFPTDWAEKLQQTDVKLTLAKRGSFLPPGNLAVSDRGRQGRKSTMVHEMWHMAQFNFPDIRRAEHELFKRRTRGNKRRLISNSKKEYTFRDKWFGSKAKGYAEYMGKDYGNDFHELGTMAFESIIFGTYPIENDHDVFDLTLGLLAAI